MCGRTIAGGRAVSTEDPTAIHSSATIRMLTARRHVQGILLTGLVVAGRRASRRLALPRAAAEAGPFT